MTDILPLAGWLNVRQLETNEFASGGANGNMNEQAKSLAARSELLKKYAALPYESKTGGYALNARVMLENGDIVKSTTPNNTVNPNVDMRGWVRLGNTLEVDSVAEMIAIENPKDGDVVKTRSHLDPIFPSVNPYRGGGLYTFDSTKVSTNNGGTIINGWVYSLDTKKVSTELFGFRESDANGYSCIKRALAHLDSVGGGFLELTDGEYLLDASTLTKPDPDVMHFNFWFEMPSNVTVFGSRRAVIKVADGVILNDADKSQCKGYQLFISIGVKWTHNFHLSGFTFDGNLANNLIPGLNSFGNQALCHVLCGNRLISCGVTEVKVKNHSGMQPFAFYKECKDTTFNHNVFENCGAVGGNINLTDHSGIYMQSQGYTVIGNIGINDELDFVSTFLECHGRDGIVTGNTSHNYTTGQILAAMDDDANIACVGNTYTGVQWGLMLDSTAQHTLTCTVTGNTFIHRAGGNITAPRSLVGIQTGGANVNSISTGDLSIFGNKFKCIDKIGDRYAIMGGRVKDLKTHGNEFHGYGKYVSIFSRIGTDSLTERITCADKLFGFTDPALFYIPLDSSGYVLKLNGSLELTDCTSQFLIQKMADATGITVENLNITSNTSLRLYEGAWDNASLRIDAKLPDLSKIGSRSFNVANASFAIQCESLTATKIRGSLLTTTSRQMLAPPNTPQVGGDIKGDIVMLVQPTTHVGYICTSDSVSGSLGVWKPFGAINA